MEFLFIGIGIVIGFLFGWLFTSNRAFKKREELRIENAELKKDKETDAEKFKWLESDERAAIFGDERPVIFKNMK